MLEKTKHFCDSFLDMGLVGFDIAVYQNGKCLLRHFNGYSDLEKQIKMNGKERYNIYSCSKVFTCTAAMQLWEKGLFSLEDKLSDYMPEFENMMVKTEDGGVRPAENPILIKHLFEMTAGFSYERHSPNMKKGYEETEGRCPTREMMRYLAKEPLLFEPGDRWEYSLCHDVLAALVEVLANQPFEEYVKEYIFDPLGMNDTTFMLPNEEKDGLAAQYVFRDGKAVSIGKSIWDYKLGSEYASGGAGAISTVDDYMKFLEALRTGDERILKMDTVKLMATDRLTEHQKRTYWTKETHGYGLGVRCPKKDAPRSIDFGWGGAAGAWTGIDVKNGISIYFGTHMLDSPIRGLRSMLYRFIRANLLDESEFETVYRVLETLHDYNLTY